MGYVLITPLTTMITFKALGNYGRLGNQLFQIATTMGVAIKNGEQYVFPYWAYARDINVLSCPPQDLSLFQWHEYTESAFTFDTNIFNIPKDKHINLSGYFQSEKYFEHCKPQVKAAILTEHNLKQREILKKKYGIDDDSCAVHVRRGDYVHLPNHYTNLGLDYYISALQLIWTTHKAKNTIVFSDDIEWCKNFFNVPNFVYSHETCDFNDLLMMSSCGYHVTANSSFSWWGSWLANSKCVIAPKSWFGPAIQHDTRDLYRSEMIKL